MLHCAAENKQIKFHDPGIHAKTFLSFQLVVFVIITSRAVLFALATLSA